VFPKAPPVGAAAGSWSDDEIVEFFHGRFDPRPDGPFIQAGTRTKMAAGTAAYSGGVAFLEAARQRARDLLQRPPVPGVDYCLTEVVHCKSKTEAVAKPAATPCAEKWLGYILRLSGARVIVCFGGLAATALGGLPDTGLGEVKPGTVESATIGGRERRVVFLPHPNAFTKRTFEILADGELEWLRASLRR
jgi:hypothetical protein